VRAFSHWAEEMGRDASDGASTTGVGLIDAGLNSAGVFFSVAMACVELSRGGGRR
jgi:hypothetical protein